MTRLRTEVTEGAKFRLMGSRDLGAREEKLGLDVLRPITMKLDCLGLNLDPSPYVLPGNFGQVDYPCSTSVSPSVKGE